MLFAPFRISIASTRMLAVLAALVSLALVACAGGERPELLAGVTVPETEATTAPLAAPTAAPVESVEPTPAPAPTPAPIATDPLTCMNQRQRLGQLLWPLGPQGDLPLATDLAFAGELGGVGLLGAPDAGIADVLAQLQAASPIEILIASDEEGGLVQRLAGPLGLLPSAAELSSTQSPEQVRETMQVYATGMRGLGVKVAFGPVVDIGGGPGIGSRSFGADPAVVTDYARAVSEGLRAGGVIPVLKHFPGHGRASADSHISLPTTPPLADLQASDLLPYQSLLADAESVMVAHLSVPGLSDETPTSMSPATIEGLLRTDLGYNGLVITDAINMGAIANQWTAPQAAELSLAAGADVVLLGQISDVAPVLDHLVAAVEGGRLNPVAIDESVQRVLAFKDASGACGAR